ncbi:MAG: hypothetical protein ABIS86_10430 [Streptosporangiaceae bacterium]
MAERRPYLVRISVSAAELGAQLAGDAVLLREVRAGLVVVLAAAGAVSGIAAIDGVVSVVPDRLEHPDTGRGPA